MKEKVIIIGVGLREKSGIGVFREIFKDKRICKTMDMFGKVL